MKAIEEMVHLARSFVVKALTLASLALATGPALGVPAFTITNTVGQSLQNPPFTLGWQFTANSPITVNALGLFDGSQNGLVESHQIGIWDSGGLLLASGTVNSGTTNPLTNQFRYVTIAALLLQTGSYQIGALYTTGNDSAIFPGSATGFATAPEISFVEARFEPGATLANPTFAPANSNLPAYFGPNFLFATVPEPGSLALLGVALAAVVVTRRRKNT